MNKYANYFWLKFRKACMNYPQQPVLFILMYCISCFTRDVHNKYKYQIFHAQSNKQLFIHF